MIRVDKTLSELWSLRTCHSHDSFQELKEEAYETSFMAINTIKSLLEENERFENALQSIYNFTLPCETNYEYHIHYLAKGGIKNERIK